MLLKLLNLPFIPVTIGVILGFILGEGSRWFREKTRIKKLKRMIKEELKCVQSQIPQKIDIVDQIIAALKQERVLPGNSVSVINTGYIQHIPELYEHLSSREKNCLHVIYERLRVADDFLSDFQDRICHDLRDNLIDDPFVVYQELFGDIESSYCIVKSLITSYLSGNPEDVFHGENK